MESPSETYPTQQELLARLHESYATFERALAGLSDEQMALVGADGWSVTDHLAHLATWERGVAGMLGHRSRWEVMGLDEATVAEGEEAINEALRQRSHGRSVAEALADFRGAHEEMVAALEAVDDETLRRPYHYFVPGEMDESDMRPIVRWIGGNSYGHYEEHLPWIEALVAGQG